MTTPIQTTPLFSVITPVLNGHGKIRATAASVLGQEPGLWEYLALDGGSTDGTLEYLRSLGPSIRVVSGPDRGIYDAMNKGIRLATGRFLYFLGAGDCLRPGVLRTVADLVPPTAGKLRLLYGDVQWPDHGGVYGGVFNAYRLACRNICHQAIFYERGIFDLLGGYDLRYPLLADYALNIRCFGRPDVRFTHFDLIIADCEGAGASAAIDHAFRADHLALVRQSLGFGATLRNIYRCSDTMNWARRVEYHLEQPWRNLPGRLWRRLRGQPTGSR